MMLYEFVAFIQIGSKNKPFQQWKFVEIAIYITTLSRLNFSIWSAI